GIRAAVIDEAPLPGELPGPYCLRIACAKARALACGAHEVLLCAATTVAVGRRILGKPEDVGEGAERLSALSARRHDVIPAIAVRRADRLWHRSVTTRVRVKRLSDAEVNAYLASGEWRGKAGGYGIQGRFAAHVPWIAGSFSAVVGLPLAETATLLAAAGFRLQADAA